MRSIDRYKAKKSIKKRKSMFSILIGSIIVILLLVIDILFSEFDNYIYLDKTYNNVISYPFFDSKKIDNKIMKYVTCADHFKYEKVEYKLHIVDNYISILFSEYDNKKVVGFESFLFDKDYNELHIKDIMNDNVLAVNIINNYLSVNNEDLINDLDDRAFILNDKDISIASGTKLYNVDYNEFGDAIKVDYKVNKNFEKLTTTTTTVKVYDKVIAFSFDDGPSKYTSEIMDTLEEYGASATFFEVGYMMKSHPEYVLDVYNRGFEIGNHTTDHSNLNKIKIVDVKGKIEENNLIFNSITGSNMLLMRPPYGNANEEVRKQILTPIIKWSVDSRDWESRNVDKIVALVEKETLDGDIVLFHDLYETTKDSIKILVPYFYENGYEIVNVSKLFEIKNKQLENGHIYYHAK